MTQGNVDVVSKNMLWKLFVFHTFLHISNQVNYILHIVGQQLLKLKILLIIYDKLLFVSYYN